MYAVERTISVFTFICNTFYLLKYVDTFYFNQSTFVAAEDYGYVLVNLTFSIELRHNTAVQFRYDDLTATCKFMTGFVDT